LTQQTFYLWATNSHQLRDPTKTRTWLFTTLYRAFLQSRRRDLRFPKQEFDETDADMPWVEPVTARHLDTAQVLEALGRVDQHYQAAVSLFYLEECSYKEIALILDVPIGTVKSRLTRGLAQLKRMLIDTGPPDKIGANQHD